VPGPRRPESAGSYRRETRAVAAVALLALAAGVVSDAFAGQFWGHHALLAGLASSVIVVLLSVALVSEAVGRRSRQRWRVLAQYVILEHVRNARLAWTVMMELAGLMPPDARTSASIDAAALAVRDTPPWPRRSATWSRPTTGAGCCTRRLPASRSTATTCSAGGPP
jgi:hypothetical protein